MGVEASSAGTIGVQPIPTSDISWHQPADAWGKAQKDGVPMLLYFFAPGLDRNVPLETSFATNPSAREFLHRHVCTRIDVNQLQGGAVAQQYGIYKVPTIMVISPDASSYKKAIPKASDTWDNVQSQLAN